MWPFGKKKDDGEVKIVLNGVDASIADFIHNPYNTPRYLSDFF